MNTLYTAIVDNANTEAQDDDWDEVASILNATSTPVRITELRNSRWLMNEMSASVGGGATEADVILGTMQASTIPRVKEGLKLMGSEGVDLSDPQTQTMLTVLATAGNWSTTIKNKLHALAFDYTSPAQLAGHPNVTAATCQSVYEAEVANDEGLVVFDKRRVLLCFNDGPVNDSLTIRVTPIGVVGGVEVKGTPSTVGGVSTGLTGKDLQLFNDLQALVDAYLEA